MSIFEKTPDDSTPASRAPVVTSCFLGVMGVLHFVKPEHFDRIVPRALPGSARFYTYASGVAELGVAGLLALPKTRRAGALAAIALYTAVFRRMCRWHGIGGISQHLNVLWLSAVYRCSCR